METPPEVLKIIELIDHNFEASKGKISRYDLKWGMWSAEMNFELKQRIEVGHEHEVYYKYLFIYWVNRSKLLQLLFEKPSAYSAAGKKRRLTKEGKLLRELAMEGTAPDDGRFDLTFTQLVAQELGDRIRKRG